MRRSWLGLLVIALVLTGCGLFASAPDQVAEAFWEAVAEGDVEEAKALSTEVDARRLARLAERHPIEEVEVGGILSRGDRAEVETTLRRETGEVVFRTRLHHFDEGWRVDAAASADALRDAIIEASLAELRDAFDDGAGAIGAAVERGLEEATDAIREALDELERERRGRPPAP